MKNLKIIKKLITILMLLLSIQGYTQNLLGYTKEEIIIEKGTPSNISDVNDTTIMLGYIYVNSNLEEGYHIENNDKCIMYCIVNTNNMLLHYINTLNNNYIKVDNNTWMYNFENFTSVAQIKYNAFENRFLLYFYRVNIYQ